VAFVDNTMSELRNARPGFGANDYFPFGLYLAGAAEGAVQRNQLEPDIGRSLLDGALQQSGLDSEAIAAFLQEWETSGDRPRFRRMRDEAKTALGVLLGNNPPTEFASLATFLPRCHDSATAPPAGDRHEVTLLLTDIVGSTALTSQIGNAGAQRVV